jgi:MFS family permease
MQGSQTKSIRKVALTSLAGTSIEWYDFFLYGTAAAIIFPKAFFPADMPAMIALIASFSTFAVGFLARPLGGIVFGHFGDRVGRKKTLVTALMIMGISTTLIGFLPTYDTIGYIAPLMLVLLRFAQGLAIGGQWGGAMLLVTESAPPDKRGWYGAYAQAGAPIGVILANLAFLGVSGSMTETAFLDWGWRIPFVASILLVCVSLYLQLNLEDTDAFKKLAASQSSESNTDKPTQRSPIIEVLSRHPGRVFLAAGAFLSIQVTFYILIAFIMAYGVNSPSVMLSRDTMLTAVLIGAMVMIPSLFWAAGMSDRVGRKRVYTWGAVLSGAWAFALFPLVDTGNIIVVTGAISVGLAFVGMQYGPQAAFFTELFSTDVRYSGASLGYQIGAILGGALAPSIAVMLWTTYGVVYVSVYMALAAIATVVCISMLSETSGKSLD